MAICLSHRSAPSQTRIKAAGSRRMRSRPLATARSIVAVATAKRLEYVEEVAADVQFVGEELVMFAQKLEGFDLVAQVHLDFDDFAGPGVGSDRHELAPVCRGNVGEFGQDCFGRQC